ncbi:MAG: transporter substrate-binding domain-containing protein [Candidatus Pacebacteria bacterium]|jgi:polar amino acid transport system substrate-binding protein|nr:transporter substrate-binding domain-containing protein [Candidatus Paceibacterota bacterium]MDD3969578.1 transporter substrate-binding domain-containing protein [Candidatus Paceibacterota bacterium]MDD4738096.1 transporter substrate-binding domain-containing protein [Candidatus Paceibacterota bacterium]
MMRKSLYFAIIASLIALIVCGHAITNQERVIVISGHYDWKPVMWQQGDEIVGIGPDICKSIFTDMGMKSVSRYVGSWEQVQQKARNGEIDVIVALYKTEEREEYLYFSDPYTVDPISVFVKEDNEFNPQEKEDLLGKKGIVTIGDSYGQEIDDMITSKMLDVVEVNTPQEAFSMLIEERADYFLYSTYAGERSSFEGIRDAGIIANQYFYIGISKNSPIAGKLPEINRILEEYKQNGIIEDFIEASR